MPPHWIPQQKLEAPNVGSQHLADRTPPIRPQPPTRPRFRGQGLISGPVCPAECPTNSTKHRSCFELKRNDLPSRTHIAHSKRPQSAPKANTGASSICKPRSFLLAQQTTTPPFATPGREANNGTEPRLLRILRSNQGPQYCPRRGGWLCVTFLAEDLAKPGVHTPRG